MGTRHIFRLVQLNTSCIDFAPTLQKQKVEWCSKNKSRQEGLVNQKYLRHILCFVAPVVSEEPLLLRGCSEMGIHLGCPWQEGCARAFCLCHAAQSSSRVTCAAGRAQGGGKLLWKESSKVSFHRDTVVSGGWGRQCLCVRSHGRHNHLGHWCRSYQASACQPWQLPGSLMSPKRVCACLRVPVEVLALSTPNFFRGMLWTVGI